jgi:hypothetical protein
VQAFESEIVGKVPANVPSVKWQLGDSKEGLTGEIKTVDQQLIGIVDNSACPEIEVKISMSLLLPKKVDAPVPVLVLFGPTSFDPLPSWMRRGGQGGNQTGSGSQANPVGGENSGSGAGQGAARPGSQGSQQTAQPTSREAQLIAAGWGVAKLNPNSVQDDAGGYRPGPAFGPNTGAANSENPPAPKGAGLTRGIIGLTNRGQPRKPDDWGALRAWAWGASRALDYLQTDSRVNAKQVGIEGVSRYGKAALVTMAFDQRFAMALIGSSGEGGVSPYRREFGETSENLASSGAYHWMAGNFLKYSADESEFGPMGPVDLPVDSHHLLALCAPRLTFVSYGVPEKGDALWLDQQGSFMATVAAGAVFRLLGAKDLGRGDNYKIEKMPPVNEGLLEGDLAWRQHDGGHTDGPNLPTFIQWASNRLSAER